MDEHGDTDPVQCSCLYQLWKYIVEKAYQPADFSLRLGLKDLNLVLAWASAVGVSMPFGNTVHKQLTQSVEEGLEEYDWTAVAMALK